MPSVESGLCLERQAPGLSREREVFGFGHGQRQIRLRVCGSGDDDGNNGCD